MKEMSVPLVFFPSLSPSLFFQPFPSLRRPRVRRSRSQRLFPLFPASFPRSQISKRDRRAPECLTLFSFFPPVFLSSISYGWVPHRRRGNSRLSPKTSPFFFFFFPSTFFFFFSRPCHPDGIHRKEMQGAIESACAADPPFFSFLFSCLLSSRCARMRNEEKNGRKAGNSPFFFPLFSFFLRTFFPLLSYHGQATGRRFGRERLSAPVRGTPPFLFFFFFDLSFFSPSSFPNQAAVPCR